MPAVSGARRRGRRGLALGIRQAGGDQHGVTKAKEAVALGHCFGISGEHAAATGKRRHQHEQRRARQVKVGKQGIDDLEAVLRLPGSARIDEELRGAPAGARRVGTGWRRRLQRAHHRRPDSHYRATGSLGGGDGSGGGGGHVIALQVHHVLVRIIAAQRRKSSRADVQGDRDRIDAARLQGGQHLRRKVQSRRGGGDRAGYFGKHRLVALAVGGLRRRVGRGGGSALAMDIRRQRHLP